MQVSTQKNYQQTSRDVLHAILKSTFSSPYSCPNTDKGIQHGYGTTEVSFVGNIAVDENRLVGLSIGWLGYESRDLEVYRTISLFVNCISRVVKGHLSNLARCISQMRVGWVVGRHASG